MNTDVIPHAQFYQLKHPEGGELNFELDQPHRFVRLFCHWPFDLITNEWINWSDQFVVNEYLSAIKRLSKKKNAVLHGLRAGTVSLKIVNDKVIELHMNAGDKSQSEEFTCQISARPCDLIPR
jgi:hypothetical protein